MTRYHLRRQDRAISDPEELKRIVKQGKYVVIAMCRQNEPYIVTLSYGYDEVDNALYFHSALEGLKLDVIAANPQVCATVIHDQGYVQDKCEHHYASVIIRGRMAVIRDLDGKKHALDVLLNHLEERPEPVKARNIKNDASYDRVAMIRLSIEDMTGKQGK